MRRSQSTSIGMSFLLSIVGLFAFLGVAVPPDEASAQIKPAARKPLVRSAPVQTQRSNNQSGSNASNQSRSNSSSNATKQSSSSSRQNNDSGNRTSSRRNNDDDSKLAKKLEQSELWQFRQEQSELVFPPQQRRRQQLAKELEQSELRQFQQDQPEQSEQSEQPKLIVSPQQRR